MKPVTEQDIRASFVNCSKGDAKRLAVPRDLAERRWDDLDFLGWRDPAAPDRGYLVAEHGDRLVGVALRSPSGTRAFQRRSMCSLCLTTHSGDGVSLMTAPRAGRAGREGNSLGLYVCSDLDCPLYLRGIKSTGPGGRLHESLTLDEQVARTMTALAAFLDNLLT
ncbi:FBP domain-containing protein [Streptacidiphilus sp. PB12-B1b]|uniref:FBP domain-containing protein n=1 Tax=Streptacidiphilus sp. PB12-B1b TaxID=2705012 RepID=UPI0015FDD8CD|nr:FBP domain-containing protein [Streptacidiphilus sp. PB12-B1b]QMU78802.1 FBP domain-containing protein [Streptacidiphilus sp. PB12-B1b]